MELATLKIENPKTVSDRRDGRLAVVSPDHKTAEVDMEMNGKSLFGKISQKVVAAAVPA